MIGLEPIRSSPKVNNGRLSVGSDPPWPVLRACSRFAASPPQLEGDLGQAGVDLS